MRRRLMLAAVLLPLAGAARADGYGTVKRSLLERKDVPGAPDLEEVMGMAEFAPAASTGRHWHHGREMAYVLEGVTLVEFDDGTTATVKAGEHIVVEAGRVHNVRADPAGPARAIAVWLVEKGKPLVEAAS